MMQGPKSLRRRALDKLAALSVQSPSSAPSATPDLTRLCNVSPLPTAGANDQSTSVNIGRIPMVGSTHGHPKSYKLTNVIRPCANSKSSLLFVKLLPLSPTYPVLLDCSNKSRLTSPNAAIKRLCPPHHYTLYSRVLGKSLHPS